MVYQYNGGWSRCSKRTIQCCYVIRVGTIQSVLMGGDVYFGFWRTLCISSRGAQDARTSWLSMASAALKSSKQYGWVCQSSHVHLCNLWVHMMIFLRSWGEDVKECFNHFKIYQKQDSVPFTLSRVRGQVRGLWRWKCTAYTFRRTTSKDKSRT
jgi:hypothetical protein